MAMRRLPESRGSGSPGDHGCARLAG